MKRRITDIINLFFFFDSTPGRRVLGEKRRTTKTNPSSIARETLFFAFFLKFDLHGQRETGKDQVVKRSEYKNL